MKRLQQKSRFERRRFTIATCSDIFKQGICKRLCACFLAFTFSLSATMPNAAGTGETKNRRFDLDSLVGRPVDIAPSAYRYRADRPADENPPECWVLLMHHTKPPAKHMQYSHFFDTPVDENHPAIKKVLCGLLWEEVRPVRRIELLWPVDAAGKPSPQEVAVTYLDASDDLPHTWWNPLVIKDAGWSGMSADGLTYEYTIPVDTWGVLVSVRGEAEASTFAVPAVRAFVPDVWKKMNVEIEWGFEDATGDLEYDGRIEAYDGIICNLEPLAGDSGMAMTAPDAWRSVGKNQERRGVQFTALYMGNSVWRRVWPDRCQPEDVARSIITVWTKSGSFSFQVSDLERGPLLAPEYGFFVRGKEPRPHVTSEVAFPMESATTTAKDFLQELKDRGLKTIRQRVREHPEQTWQGAVTSMQADKALPPHPTPPFEPEMQIEVPSERLMAQWNLGSWHILRRSVKDQDGKWHFNDFPFGVLAAETYQILRALDFQGRHQEAADGLDQWLGLPMQPLIVPGQGGHQELAPPDRPLGYFSDGRGCFTHAEGPDGVGGNMDGIHPAGPGMIMQAMNEHFRLTGDMAWLKTNAERMKANAEWILRQRGLLARNIPGGQRLWCKGLQPAMCGTTDANVMFAQFYIMEAYYWLAVKHMADLLTLIDPSEGTRMQAEVEAYRKDIVTSLDRSITLTPVVAVRDGTYRSFIPHSPYVRGCATRAWGWRRCQGHVSAIYWDAGLVQTPLISPSGLLSLQDRRVQGFLDVLEDRLLLENQKVNVRTSPYDPDEDWFAHAGWQYQCGFERTPNIHLEADDVPNFIRSMLNQYAVDILPDNGYTFREHTIGGPPDKIFEESCFLERLRNMLVMEEGDSLWLARATPRVWLEQGERISVKNAPTHFGTVAYEIVSDVDNGKVTAMVELPSRSRPESVLLRFRHPRAAPITSVEINHKRWNDFDNDRELIRLHDLTGRVSVQANY